MLIAGIGILIIDGTQAVFGVVFLGQSGGLLMCCICVVLALRPKALGPSGTEEEKKTPVSNTETGNSAQAGGGCEGEERSVGGGVTREHAREGSQKEEIQVEEAWVTASR